MWQNWIEKIVDWIVPVLCTIIIGGFCIAAGFSRGCELKEQAAGLLGSWANCSTLIYRTRQKTLGCNR